MVRYLTLVEDRLKRLDEWTVRHIPQIKNLKVDTLTRIAATLSIREVIMLPIYLQSTPSITPKLVCSATKVDPDWMHDIVKYLKLGELPEDKKHGTKSAYRPPVSP
ncbi:hypothetical protein CK203_100867 [Vitis vinifera]|uniref:RNase H type-1 domain-containing protein n=1 Tax=Vitis vinifera TaxID=29760 RepID=A0A438CZI9_VITVI|nr:hypothetical protein CK203_100867 [Vitis vinifera]